MIEKQQTIAQERSISGIGLHTGQKVKLTFKPAPENHWAVFLRTDLDNAPKIPALVEYALAAQERGTILEKDGIKVFTVEHVLAALAGLQIDNVLIELDGPEPPVLDGSAMPYVETLKNAGIVQQNAPRNYFAVKKVIQLHDDERQTDIHIIPYDGFRITMMVDYPDKPSLGTQYTTLTSIENEFVEGFAPARTFCFLSEIEEMLERGLIKGGNPDNALVVIDKEWTESDEHFLRENFDIAPDKKLFGKKEGFLNDIELRFYNEPVRHKLIDLLGDLHLLGFPIKAHIIGARPGHAPNINAVWLIKKQHEKYAIAHRFGSTSSDAMLDIDAIQKVLPHRYPFLLVDRVMDFEPEKWAEAIKNVSVNELFFNGHFPGHPIMPGVLIVEALAQAGGFLLMQSAADPEKDVIYFMGIDKVRFRKPVVPGDQLRMRVEMISQRRRLCKFSGKAFVGDDLVCEGEFMAVIAER